MIPYRIPLLLAVAGCLLSSATRGNDIEPGKEYYTAIKAPQPIVLDGDLSEWSGAALLADPRFSIPKGSGDAGELVFFEEYNGGVWTGPDDQTSAVQVVYDDDNVYFGFIVTDDYHENSANSAWNGDSVQLMIANAARDTQVALYNYALGGVEDALGEIIIMHEAGPGGTEAIVTRNTETKRTYYEIKLPKESLGLETLQGGVRFGLGMAINDGDEDTPGQRGWGGLGAHALVFGKSPSETALVTLAMSNDIEPGKEYYTANPAPNPIVLDGSLGEWTGIPVLSDPRFAIPKGSAREGTLVLFEEYSGGVWTGPDDQTSAVQIVYDAENIYFGFVVTDDYHENSANSAWNGDSVQLMVANGDQDTQVALYNYALGGIEDALGDVIIMHEAGPGGTEAVVTRNSETKRTTYEIKLPAASMGFESLGLGTQFGLGMAINDGDEDTPGQRGWGGLGAHALVFGKSPSETALVTLGVGGASSDLLFLSAINPTGKGFSFRANDKGDSIVDPDSARLIIDGAEVPLTASPKQLDATDFTYTRATLFASGVEHTYLIEVSDTNDRVVTEVGTFSFSYTQVSSTVSLVTAVITDPKWFAVDESAGVTLELDGAAVTPDSVTRTATNQITIVYSQAPERFPSLSSHILAVTFQTMAGETVTDPAEFVAPQWNTLPPAIGTAPGTGAEPGMRWKTHLLQTSSRPSTVAGAEAQLRNEHGPSIHDPTFWDSPQAADGYFRIDWVNIDQVPAAAGRFNESAAAPLNVADAYIPGTPQEPLPDYLAAEALTFLELPVGFYTMVVNSDDGFQVSTGNANEPTWLVLGEFDGARGQADTQFYFNVEQAGVYFFRLLWFEGTGDARVEWFTLNADGSAALVNGTQTGAVKAYRTRTVPEPDLPATPIDVPMEVTFDGATGEVVISWDAAVQSLQESGDLLNWSNVAGSSPFRATASGPAKYYRLLVGQ